MVVSSYGFFAIVNLPRKKSDFTSRLYRIWSINNRPQQ
jgi:hypothetical protein